MRGSVNINKWRDGVHVMTELTVERLKELVSYDPDTGIFQWAMARRKCRKGDAAGCRMTNGYIGIRIDNVLHNAHRLAWLYTHGVWPTDQIDHVNNDRADNRLVNLREATNIANSHNRRKSTRNTSGFTGVRRENSKWQASIKVNYKAIRLGLFDTPEEASAAYQEAKQRLHHFG